jgi:hypothetical protein
MEKKLKELEEKINKLENKLTWETILISIYIAIDCFTK